MSQDEAAKLQAALDRVLGTGAFSAADLQLMRTGLDAYASAVARREPIDAVTNEMLRVEDRDIALRTYQPAGAYSAALVWFHGGGYVSGSLDAIDPICRSLARRLSTTVVSVDYRLAPEHPYPAALQDCLAALEAVAARPGVGPLAVGGDSAGGGLAAATARRTQVPLEAMLLLCPFLDATLSSPSVRTKGTDYLLTEESLGAFARMYVGPGGDRTDAGVSPLLGQDFGGLPPTVVVTAENDPLCDEGERYAEQVVAAGGVAYVRRWDKMLHGFVGMTADLPEADEALQWSADQLRPLLNPATDPAR